MATTNNFSLPYPLGDDPYNIPEDIANLAKSIDSSLKAVSDSVATLDYSTTETVEEVQRNLEILEQEINRAGLPNVEQIMVDIEEARKELEAAKEEFSIGQAELGVHLTNLRDERMPALEKSVRDAQDEMDTAMDEFMTRQTQFEDSISTAETEIEAAKKRLDTTETDVEAAIEYAGNAQTAAEAAESRAVEAMSFVSTVLQNGSFEDGLTNWTATGGAGVTDDITRSGELAGLLPELGDALTYDETLTAVAGQVWELSGFYYCGIDPQIGITFTYYDENGAVLETVSETEMAGRVGVWNSFGPFRIEAPENSATMGFSIESVTDTGYVRVDDIALRDVTDVVRLEHAATAARQTAEQALAELELMRLALDGPGGLQDRLDTAENVLEDKADASLLPQLESRLEGVFGTGIATALDTAAADAQTKADEAIATAQAQLEALEIGSRNLVKNQVETVVPSSDRPAERIATAGRIEIVGDNYSNTYFFADNYVTDPDFVGGLSERTYTVSFDVRATLAEPDARMGFRFDIRTPGIYSEHVYFGDTGGEWQRISVSHTFPANAPRTQSLWAFRGARNLTPGDIIEYRNWKLEKGNKATGWTPAPEDIQASIDAAQAKAEEAHTNAGEAHAQADAAMTRAGAAETNAKDHADGLPKVLHGTGAPSGTAPNGSIWWRHQGALSGPVIGQWNRVNGSWRSTPIDSEAIANLDVGKLTAGSAEIGEAVIGKLWAELGVFDRLEATEGWIGGTMLEDGVVVTKVLEAAEQIITNMFASNYGLIENELVVKGNLFAENATLINAAMQSLSVTEMANFVTAFADELYADEFAARVARVAQMIVAAPNIYGNADFHDMSALSRRWQREEGLWGYKGAILVNDENTGQRDTTDTSDAGTIPLGGTPGLSISARFRADIGATETATLYVVVAELDENMSSLGATQVLTWGTTGSGVETVTATYEVQNANAAYARLMFGRNYGGSGIVTIGDVLVKNLLDGQLIATGSVKTPQLDVNEIFGNTAVLNKLFADLITARVLNAQEALIGGANIKNDSISVGKLTALDEILTEMLRVRKIDAGDIAADAITAGKIAGGAIDGKTITGSRVRTSASGRRVEMHNDAMTAYDSSGSIQARYSGDGIELRPPGGSLTEIGAHIFGAEVITRATNQPWTSNTNVPEGSGTSWGPFLINTSNTMAFPVVSRDYVFEMTFTVIYGGGNMNENRPSILSSVQMATSSANTYEVMNREFYTRGRIENVEQQLTFTSSARLPTRIPIGSMMYPRFRFRTRAINWGATVFSFIFTATPK